MTTARKKLIRREILKALELAKPYLLPESTLQSSVSFEVVPPPTLSEFEEVIKQMESARLVIRLRTEDEVKTKITDEGSAELLS